MGARMAAPRTETNYALTIWYLCPLRASLPRDDDRRSELTRLVGASPKDNQAGFSLLKIY